MDTSPLKEINGGLIGISIIPELFLCVSSACAVLAAPGADETLRVARGPAPRGRRSRGKVEVPFINLPFELTWNKRETKYSLGLPKIEC